MSSPPDPAEIARVRSELRSRGFAVVRGLLPAATIERAKAHLEKAVGRHLEARALREARADAK